MQIKNKERRVLTMYIEGNIKLKDHLLNCIKDQWRFSEMKIYFVENAERFVEKGL